jgi:hypothetical protein
VEKCRRTVARRWTKRDFCTRSDEDVKTVSATILHEYNEPPHNLQITTRTFAHSTTQVARDISIRDQAFRSETKISRCNDGITCG